MNFVSVYAKVREYAVAPFRGFGFSIFYRDNFRELENHVMELKDARESIQYSVEKERREGKEIKPHVLSWLGRSDGIIAEAEQLLVDPGHAKVRCSFPNFLIRHRLSKKAKTMAAKIEEQEVRFDQVSEPPAASDGVGSTSATTRIAVALESRVSIMNASLDALRDPEVSMVGVYGLAGVGKTTLAKIVAEKAMGDKLFDVVAMASVSRNPDLRRIQGQIADMLGVRLVEETQVGRAYRLQARIRREKTILIILDDIWESLDLDRVGIPSGDDHKGCKVLLTSRSLDVCHRMGAQMCFRLDVLNEQEAYSLFDFTAGDVAKDPSMRDIAIEVTKACSGLPLLLITVARALQNQDIYAWEDALLQLKKSSITDEHGPIHAIRAVELTYQYLRTDELKSVFLLCGLLGQSSISDLLRNGMGLGIFKKMDNMEEARNRLYKLISDLKSSCLLLEHEDAESIKMHDIVRQAAISIASKDQKIFIMEENARMEEWPTPDFLTRCTQIILDRCYIQELRMRLDCPKLRLLYVNSANHSSLNIPNSFFEGMRRLRVLNLTCVNMSILPASLCLLLNLKTLCLDQCALEDMNIIGALKNLEILSLKKSSMTALPPEIRELTLLRMLDLSSAKIEFIPPNIISNLIRLEELYMGDTGVKWEVDNSIKQNKNASLEELRQLPNLTALEVQIHEAWTLPGYLMYDKLERYKIVVGDVWEWPETKFGIRRILKLKLHTSLRSESVLKDMIQNVEDLSLDEINGISNILYQLNEEGFPQLKHLHIQNNEQIKHIINSAESSQVGVCFPNLETLVLDNLCYLDKICHGPLAVNSFQELRSIKVRNCYRLQSLFHISMVKGLSKLLEIEVSESKSMTEIVTGGSDSNVDSDPADSKVEFQRLRSLTLQELPALHGFYFGGSTSSNAERMPFFNPKAVFPGLENLKLSSLNLKKIWDKDQLSTTSLKNLTRLVVEDCGDIKYLFSSAVVGSLLNLEQLKISECHKMEEILRATEGTIKNEVLFPNLEKLIISDMKNLKTIWQWHRQPAPKSFGRLKRVEVKNCEKLVTIFSIKNP